MKTKEKKSALNGPVKEKKLTLSETRQIALFKSVEGILKDEFEKGLIKHPVRQ